ncbi:hypothetical protein Q5752_000924 [Cryptotrichosporon argae]
MRFTLLATVAALATSAFAAPTTATEQLEARRQPTTSGSSQCYYECPVTVYTTRSATFEFQAASNGKCTYAHQSIGEIAECVYDETFGTLTGHYVATTCPDSLTPICGTKPARSFRKTTTTLKREITPAERLIRSLQFDPKKPRAEKKRLVADVDAEHY